MEMFPTPEDCARAPQSQVVRAWRGLGYPRRARYVHLAARRIVDDFEGRVPRSVEALRTLPGVGPYTAAAVASFAFGAPEAVLDTNVGRVLARAIANRRLNSTEARDLARELLPATDAAAFNQALMDLGAQFCRSRPRCAECPLASQCRWSREGGPDPAPLSAAVSRAQKPYRGSRRQLRGEILARVSEAAQSRSQLRASLSGWPDEDVTEALSDLSDEGLVVHRRSQWRLAGD